MGREPGEIYNSVSLYRINSETPNMLTRFYSDEQEAHVIFSISSDKSSIHDLETGVVVSLYLKNEPAVQNVQRLFAFL